MAQINVDIKPRGIASAYVEAPFDEGKEALAEQGYKIISLEENAKLRMQEGKDTYVSRNGNWVKEGVIYVLNKGIFLAKNSPIMADAKKATDCHRKNQEFYLTNEQVEQALADSVELNVESIPTNRFADDKITVYAFGDSAKEYGEFLKEAGINEMPVYLANIGEKPFARQMWLGDLGNWSGLSGDGRYLDCSGRVRGVRESAEGAAKNFEAYTPAQIAKALKSKGLSGIENILTEALRQ